MIQRLRIPNETRFVRAFALPVDPGDLPPLLMAVSALADPDVAIVHHALETPYPHLRPGY